MSTDTGPARKSDTNATQAYRNKLGFLVDFPNFPAKWHQIVAEQDSQRIGLRLCLAGRVLGL